MFSNRFNTRNDPLLEAAQAAMKDGETRRQAEAFVNEQFGVYSRKAVVREELAAYDAALEEAYGALKEGVQLDELKKPTPETAFRVVDRANNRDEWSAKAANRLYSRYKKAYEPKEKKTEVKEGNDDNLANNYPPYDKVTRGDVIAGATGKDQMGGKRKKMDEEQIDERNLLKRMKDTMRLGSSGKERVDRISGALSDRGGNWDYKKGDFTEKGKSQVKSRLKNVKGASDYALNKEETQIDELQEGILRKALQGIHDWSEKKVKEKQAAAHKKVVNKLARQSLKKMHDDANKIKTGYETRKEGYELDEAAYSAKAARAGKDIGKPGKQFSKIAKSAGKRYGSEERGKKVAGAILARIRAKHMKEENLEELSAFGAEFAKQRAAGAKEFSFGGKSYSTAMKGQSSTAPSSGTMNRISPAPKTASIASQAAQASTIKQSGGTPPGNVKPNKTGPKDYPDIGNVAKGKSFDAIDKARTSAASSVPTPPSRPDQVTLNKAARDRSISDAGFKLGTHTNTTYNPSSPGQQATVQSKTVEKGWADAGEVENKARATGSFQQQRDGKVLPPSSQLGTPKSMDPVQGGVSSAPTTPKAAPTPPSRPAGLKESVQIGDYKYRIL